MDGVAKSAVPNFLLVAVVPGVPVFDRVGGCDDGW